MKTILALTLLFALQLQANPRIKPVATKFSAKVVSVKDGDTIVVVGDSMREVVIRLYGVDTPERKKGQPYNRNAKDFTSDLSFGKTVEVEVIDIDRYKRSVSVIKLPDGKNLNQALVEGGYAWVYPQYCKKDFCEEWKKLEAKARFEKKGLWQDKLPVEPWKWRRN